MKDKDLPECLMRPPVGLYCDNAFGRAFIWWISIRNFYGIMDGPSLADIDHSALLRRLLSGKPPTKSKPPLVYSYPDYEAAEAMEQIDFPGPP